MRGFQKTISKTAVWLRRFVRANDGNTAIVFAVTSIGILGAGGAGVDMARTIAAKNRMAAALDAAALAVGGTNGLSTDALNTMAQQYFNANYRGSALATASPVHVAVDGQKISLTVEGTVETTLLHTAGVDDLHVSVTNQVIRAMSRLRVALVLDNTGSMAETDASGTSKMAALKTATHQLLTQLQGAAANPGDVEVAIVPFAREVNVGSSNVAASWLDWTSWNAANMVCSKTKYTSKSKCLSNGGTWAPASHSTWNGCVMDRDQDNDVLNTTPTASDVHTLFPAQQSPYCPASLLGLGHDWTALGNKVDTMVPSGATNQTIGLSWGWQALTSGAPMSAPALPPDTTQVIILLSDGLNTQDRWYGDGVHQSAQVDARMALACANAKAAHIQIYTVLVMAGSSDVLQSCASDTGKYYALTTAGAIITTFNTIGTQLANLHLTR